MTDTLLHAYVPLVLWTGLGLLLVPFLPDSFPRLLGRSLYWVGVPVQIFTLAHQTDFSVRATLVPAIALWAILAGLAIASFALWGLDRRSTPPAPEKPSTPDQSADSPNHLWHPASRRGAFLLASILGNTGFVGLAVVPTFIDEPYRGWVVLYSITHNVLGTYGVGVVLASFYGRSQAQNPWFTTVRDILTVPSLWAFGLGILSRPVVFPTLVEVGLQRSLWVIIPAALLLMGIRLRQIKGWQGLKMALVPTTVKTIGLPVVIGLTSSLLHLPDQPRLAMVLMAGMPTAFAGLILAEEYDLERELIASSIVVSTLTLFATLPLWLWLYGH